MTGKGAWEVARYETDMLEALVGDPSQIAMGNARTESIVLHARQLCEMFLSSSARTDNVKLVDLVPEKKQSDEMKKLISQLRSLYGSSSKKESPCWVFNKMLLHPTKARMDGYNYAPALTTVMPVLKLIIMEIESVRGTFERHLKRKPTSAA